MSNVINLDSRRKVPSILQQIQTIKDDVIQDVINAYAHLPMELVAIACKMACNAVDEGAGTIEATRVAGRYLSATMEVNRKIYGDSWTSTITK